ncbi:MAG TPA: HAMP domain-containing sensor histidine kinase [Gemmatimonadaceae bacterium]|nr:HAMP domain-containing sensor histidine kinase [Gemmatimonadaceae bacterium]
MATRITEPRRVADVDRVLIARGVREPGLDLAVELAHDVRSPLGAMLTIAELLESGACGPVTDAQVRQLKCIQNAARGLSRMTEDVVDSGRVGALDVRGSASTFSIDDTLSSVHDALQPMAELTGLQLIARNHAPAKWMGRRGAIARVLLNLVTNALKYTERGSVVFGARVAGINEVEFFVCDSGSTPALQRDSASPGASGERWRTKGAGLGLAICRRLLHAMGTTLEVETQPGVGTQFYFVVALPDAA